MGHLDRQEIVNLKAALDIVTKRATDAERRLALAVAEVRAWRAVTLQPGWTGTLPVGAMVATDADPELAKMIGGG
jgi:hypothetical protein